MKQKGFTILFAVLVSSIVLALGLGIVAITMKEVQLSGTGRDSQLAFYAADSGAECAFYWDLKGDYFATSSPWALGVNQSDMKCNNQIIFTNNGWTEVGSSGSATTTFWFTMASANSFDITNSSNPNISKPCTKVQVGKYNVGGEIKTTIDARGYNTCDTTNARRLERGYQINY